MLELIIALIYLGICSFVSKKLIQLPANVPPVTAEVSHIILGALFPFIFLAVMVDYLVGNVKDKKPDDQ